MRLATALLEEKNAKPWFHRYLFAFHILSFWCILLGAAENVSVLILLASPIMLPFKQPTGLIEVWNLGRRASTSKFACQPLISHPFLCKLNCRL